MKRVLYILLVLIALVGVVSADTAILFTTNETDGYVKIFGNNLTFTNLRNGAGTSTSTTVVNIESPFFTSGLGTEGYTSNSRGVYIFNGSGIPDDATINSATFGTYRYASGIAFGDVELNVIKFNIRN